MMKRPLRCPTCNKPFTPEPVLVCLRCHLPMLRGHKWTIRGGHMQHRHCDWPDSYLSKADYIAQYGLAMWQRMHPR